MKQVILLTLVIIAFVFYIVYSSFARTADKEAIQRGTADIKVEGCSDRPPRNEALASSELSSLRKLGELEKKCNSQVTTNLMHFIKIPKDANVAKKMAEDTAKVLKEMHDAGIQPYVIVEPDSEWGLVDFKEFNTGFWDAWIATFFESLKDNGVTDDMMGTWVPFPEANLPYWNHQNTQPADFSAAVNRYAALVKADFPDAKVSVLLNSATYPTDDYNWADGEYVSLLQYVSGLNQKNIDSFGIQGLPWMPAANEKGDPLFTMSEILQGRLVEEAATAIGTKKVWFNTGTFAAKYTQDSEKKVIVPADVRKQMLTEILAEAVKLKNKGYDVTVNIFAEDKSNVAEATDWSYWGSQFTTNTSHEVALLNFLKAARKAGIAVSFFLR